MFDGKAFQLYGPILEEDLRLLRRRRVEMQRKIQPPLSHLLMKVKDLLQPIWTVDVEWSGPAQQVERGHQPRQTEVVVPMQMGNADVVDAHHSDALLPQSNLRALPTIQQELLLMDIDDLGGRIPARQGQSSPAAQDVDFEAQAPQRWTRRRRTWASPSRRMRRK